MRTPRTFWLPVVIVLVLLLSGSPVLGIAAQEDPSPSAEDTTLVSEETVELPDGERAWLAIYRPSVSDDDPPIDAHEGMIYALDAPLMLLYEGESRVERVPQGEALALHDGERVRPVSTQAGPAALLVVGLADPEGLDAGDAYTAVGEPFEVPADTYTLSFRRYDLTVRPGRTVQQVQQQIAALPAPALLYVEQGEVTATPVGQDAAATLKQYQATTADAASNIAVSDDGAVILLVTLEPAEETGTGQGTTSAPGVAATGGTSTAVPAATESATSEPPTATEAPTTVPTAATVDTDGDGLPDTDEASRGTNPASNDSDGDGVFDGYEVSVGLDPTRQDTDGDGVSDYDEVPEEPEQGSGDADGDGLTDGYEGQVSLTDPNNRDSDGDGLSDGDEVERGTNPLNRDSDGDGLSDGFEVNQGTSPSSVDSDGDGVDDGYETGRGMNPNSGDSDGDGLGDGEEMNAYGTNPLNPDSDGDERSDGYEVNCGQDPNTYTDYSDVVACG